MQYKPQGLGIHLEISSNCNSKCLDCGRYVKGTDVVNPNVDVGSKGLLSIDYIDNIFDNKICSQIKYVNFTGTYGDAITHPNFFDIISKIGVLNKKYKEERLKNNLKEKIIFKIETNAGLHNENFWKTFSEIINNNFDVDFSVIIVALDGIDDKTHQLYRRGVDFNKVLANCNTMIANNLNLIWSMIVFDHNEHQVAIAKEQSKKLGFKEFKIRRSRLRHQLSPFVPVIENIYQKNQEISKKELNYSNNVTQNLEKKVIIDSNFYFEKPLKERKEYKDTEIICEWKKLNRISIDYTGRVWQCCYFSTFYHTPIQFNQLGKTKKIDVNKASRKYENLKYYEDMYDQNWNNIKYHNLSKIMQHNFFTKDLPISFNNSINDKNNPRIARCTKFCGKNTRNMEKNIQKKVNATY
tara:strand:- start:1578 stop:2807 length:1230 start_codon:yes stop_codon:yes gene_type:complete